MRAEQVESIKYSLVIPCFNEGPSLHDLILKCSKLCNREDVEVILVNNGSTDNSQQVLNDLVSTNHSNLRVVHLEQNEGYGGGILAGLRSSKGQIMGWTHADLQTDPNDFAVAINLIEQSKQRVFVKGSRKGRPWSDVFFTVGMSIFETALLKKALWDINAQPTIFNRDFYLNWHNPPKDFSLDLFAYFGAKRSGIRVIRFPVKFSERKHGISKWNVNWAAKKKFILRTLQFSFELRKSRQWK